MFFVLVLKKTDQSISYETSNRFIISCYPPPGGGGGGGGYSHCLVFLMWSLDWVPTLYYSILECENPGLH